MLTLVLNILILLIGVGGAIVSSLTLSNARARFWFVVGFSLMGALGLVLTIITYESTPDVPHLGDALGDLGQAISSFSHRYLWVWTVLCVAVGLVVGALGTRFLPKHVGKDKTEPVVRNWLDPIVAIERHADPVLRAQLNSLRQKAESLKTQIDSLNQQFDAEVKKLPFGPSPNHDSELVAELGRKHSAAATLLNELGEQVWSIEREITRRVLERLKNGDLAAKGFRQTKDSVADASEIIPKDQWQLLRFDTYDIHMQTARGGNWKYIGLQIGRNENKRR
jgi:hypothetical protein